MMASAGVARDALPWGFPAAAGESRVSYGRTCDERAAVNRMIRWRVKGGISMTTIILITHQLIAQSQ